MCLKTMGTNHPAMQHHMREELRPPCDKTALSDPFKCEISRWVKSEHQANCESA